MRLHLAIMLMLVCASDGRPRRVPGCAPGNGTGRAVAALPMLGAACSICGLVNHRWAWPATPCRGAADSGAGCAWCLSCRYCRPAADVGVAVVQQARNLALTLAGRFENIKFLIRDRGSNLRGHVC